MTLADEDTNSILTDNYCKWHHMVPNMEPIQAGGTKVGIDASPGGQLQPISYSSYGRKSMGLLFDQPLREAYSYQFSLIDY